MSVAIYCRVGAVAAAFALVLTGCDQGKSENSQAAKAPTPEVAVVTLEPQRTVLTTELPGRVTPYRIADVRPQVSGVIQKRLFEEGGEVKAGQQLYQIDPAPYQAAFGSAQASLARAEATLKSATLLAERYRPLVAAHAVSHQDYDNAVAAQQQAQADVASGKAAVETARINLVYTKVLSPISGRVGRSSVTEGALVTANQSTALATVQQLDPIYVDVTQSSVEMLRLQREMAAGRLQQGSDGQALANLVLEDGSAYSEAGKLLFSEVTVDPGTGSVTLRARYSNPKRLLLPGMFVHERIEEGVVEQALLVPQQSVARNPRGEPIALVIGANDTVEQKVLKVDRALGDKWLVIDGVKAGDKVIVEGLQKVRPGVQVRTVTAANGVPAQPGPAPVAR